MKETVYKINETKEIRVYANNTSDTAIVMLFENNKRVEIKNRRLSLKIRSDKKGEFVKFKMAIGHKKIYITRG